MTQSTIDFLLNNNVTIIQIVFGIIFLLVIFVILRSFKEEKAQGEAPSKSVKNRLREEYLAEKEADKKNSEIKPTQTAEIPKDESPLDDLDNLDDLMGIDSKEATQEEIDLAMQGMSPNSAAPAPAASAQAQTAQVNDTANAELAAALTEKEQVIASLKTEIETLRAKPAAEGNSKELEAKVKELSEKLSEYEIIEDDIANLSFYKTENAKLKNELEKLKSGSSDAVAAVGAEIENQQQPEAPTEPPAPEPTVKEPKAPEPTPVAATPAPTESTDESTDSILNEFEEAVKQKEALEKTMQEAPAAPPPQAPSAPPATAQPGKTDADLLKEFESVVEKEFGKSAVAPKAEAKPAGKPAPAEAKAAPKTAPPKEEINSNKLVEEMEALATAKIPESKEDTKDANQKLIEEFENFVNKN